MGERVRRTAIELGVQPAGLDVIDSTYAAVMESHIERLEAHDVDFLHPGRSALILMLDVQESDSLTLAAATLVDSEGDGWRGPLGDDPRLADVVALARSVPVPITPEERSGSDPSRLLEALVVAEPNVQRIALAERLDHVRHAHLWDDLARRRAAHATAVAVYAPLAARVHERLSRRYDRWCGMFAKRHLPEGS